MFASSAPSGAGPAEDVDGFAGPKADQSALRGLALAEAGTSALALALTVERVDAVDLHSEDLLNGNLDLRLVGVGPDDEGVGAFFDQAIALLGDNRGEDDVTRVG